MNIVRALTSRRCLASVLLIALLLPQTAQAWHVIAGGGARTFVVPPHPMPGPHPPGPPPRPRPMPPPPPPPPPPHHGDDWYHPWATAAVVGATTATAIAIGTAVASVPKTCVPVLLNGVSYQQCGSTWYQPQYVGTSVQYVVVVAPR